MSTQDISIRQATEQDLRSLQVFLPSTIPGFIDEILNEYRKKESQWLLAMHNQDQVGHIRIRWAGNRNLKVKEFCNGIPNLEALGVKNNFQSNGIGSKLLEETEKLLKNSGYAKWGLSVDVDDEKLKTFYMKRGYADWGRGTYTSKWDELGKHGEIIKRSQEYLYLIKVASELT